VLAGECVLRLHDATERLPLRRGDLVLLPAGRGHSLGDSPDAPEVPLEELIAQHGISTRLRHGGNGEEVELLCGGFDLAGGGTHPILTGLPPVIVISASAGESGAWLGAIVDLIRAEFASDAPGTDAVVTRLSDLLLTQAVREQLQRRRGDGGAPVSALGDREIAKALTLIHTEPDRAWTVSDLADRVALSRSAFAERFRALTGEPPIRYLTRVRLTLVAQWLRDTDLTLAEIAVRSGYESEASLSKAFKRHFGIAPGRFRSAPRRPPELIAAE
jgi:AraC-like DNA-binding protein